MRNIVFPIIIIIIVTVDKGICQPKTTGSELPNILWITSEDNSPFAGCYGDTFATTPNLDKLASEGFLYTHAYANAPVCAPARNTIITGVYANSSGNQHMRSYYPKSDKIRLFPEYLREQGYYCTNNKKKDYNIDAGQITNVWDECSEKAHYKNRKAGQPFFAVFNTMITHESCLHQSIPIEQLKHDPQQVPLPPYHPDTPEMRHDWAQYYDKVEEMDKWVGEKLKELDDAGLAENTIVVYYGDHGGVLGRSKRYLYETGTRVPFIIRIPEKYKHLFPEKKIGSQVNRLITFVDLAPTILSIIGVKIPEYMQGNAFLGDQKTANPKYAHMFRGRMDERYDMSRAVRDGQYRYIKNYMPYRIYGQHLNYLWQAPSIPSWENAYQKGRCDAVQSAFWEMKPVEELYDTENDPWEIRNLADDPRYEKILLRMRKENITWMKRIADSGFIPEDAWLPIIEKGTMYDYVHSHQEFIEKLIDAAEAATTGTQKDLSDLKKLMGDSRAPMRYWGITGALLLGKDGKTLKNQIDNLLTDSCSAVVILSAEAIYRLGEKDRAVSVLLSKLDDISPFVRLHALNTIDCLDEFTPLIRKRIEEMIDRYNDQETPYKFDVRLARYLLSRHVD